jgi:hypothetical protein
MYTMISPSLIVFFLFVESTISGKQRKGQKKKIPTIYYFIYASLQQRTKI